MKFFSAIIFCWLYLCTPGMGQNQITPSEKSSSDQTHIQWISWEEAQQMNQREKRKILLDVYTDWCKWCERMDNETLQHPEVARYINKHFYPVKLNAEQRTEWQYKDKTYGFIRNGKRGYHELAYELMGGRMSFPTVIFMDEDLNVIQCIVGYKSVEQFEKILTYFATDHYKRTPWSTFQQMQESMLISD